MPISTPHPWAIGSEQAAEIALRCEAAARKTDRRITNSEGAGVSVQQSHFFAAHTRGFRGGYASSRHSVSVAPIAGSGDDMQRDAWYTSMRASEDLASPEQVGRYAAERALSRLRSRKVATTECPVLFEAPAVVLATGGIGKSFKVSSNSWEYTGDGHALALRAGSSLINMEFIQFHPTGMVWPLSVKGILVTEGVRGDGGVLKNSEGKRFMFDYIPSVFKGQYAETEEEADQWLKDNDSARRTPDLLPRDEVARAINSEVKAGRGSPHGGVFLDIATRMTPEEIKRRLPSMYHQFLELAEVDITKDEMEVGPTCHYVMGGIEVDPDSGGATTPGLFAAGECSGGMHGSNRLGGNSLSDLLVFGRRAGLGAADYVRALSNRPAVSDAAVEAATTSALAPFEPKPNAENPYTLHADLQETMNDLVGIIRKEAEIEQALAKLDEFKKRYANVVVDGGRIFNPGWHLAIDMRNMLLVSECVAKAALQRTESRGGHTRDDHPDMDANWRNILLVCRTTPGQDPETEVPDVTVTPENQLPMRADLLATFELSELKKYYTAQELAEHPEWSS